MFWEQLLFGGVGGALVAAIWGTLSRMWVDAKLHRLKDELDRRQFIHRLQFETEFAAYRALWAKAVEVRRAALSLRPIVDSRPADKSTDEIKRERVKKFDDANVAFTDHYNKRKPFLSEIVYKAADKLSRAAYNEGVEYYTIDPYDRPHYWSESQESAKTILALANKLCDAIRERIWVDTPLVELAESQTT